MNQAAGEGVPGQCANTPLLTILRCSLWGHGCLAASVWRCYQSQTKDLAGGGLQDLGNNKVLSHYWDKEFQWCCGGNAQRALPEREQGKNLCAKQTNGDAKAGTFQPGRAVDAAGQHHWEIVQPLKVVCISLLYT